MLTIDEMPNGNIVLTPEDCEKQTLKEMHEKTGDETAILCEAMEHYSCNGSYTPCNASDIGALSEAPVIAESMDVTDDGEMIPEGGLWYFPDYMLRDPIAEMLEHGYVIFNRVGE